MEQPKLSNNCQTSPSAGGREIAHARRAELAGRWRYSDTDDDCNREERQGEYARQEVQEKNRCRADEVKEQEFGCDREQERLVASCHRDGWEQQEPNCTQHIELWSESCESILTWRNKVTGKGSGSLQDSILPPCSEWFSRDAASLSGSECKVDVQPPADGKWAGSDAAPPVGGGDEWRKKKHRRRPSKRKRRWKPYFKLSWEEKQQLEEREGQRAARLRAEMFAKGQPVAPYNTTQFLMEDHAQAEPDLRSGGGTESSEDEPIEEESEGPGSDGTGGPAAGLRPRSFLLKDFSETYERYHTESLQNMSKQQLVREYLELEKCLSRMEDENSQLRKQGPTVSPGQATNEKGHPRKDLNNRAGVCLQHPHNRGTEHHQAILARNDADPGTDPINTENSLHFQSGNFHRDTGSLRKTLQLFRCESQAKIQPSESQHPRIRELELELNLLRAQNTQLMYEKKKSSPNSCRD